MSISTRDLSLLPDIDRLRRVMRSMAVLDAILSPEWEYRYFSFNARWSVGAQMGSMRNGSGDDVFAHFSSAGCWMKGFAHEYPMSPYGRPDRRPWPGVIDRVPAEFAECLREPAFTNEDVTFCLWRRRGDAIWQVGAIDFPPDHPDPDGSSFLLSIYDGRPESYREFAADYFEQDVSFAAVEHVYRHLPLAPEVIAALNPDLTLDELAADLEEIGYPATS